MTGNRIGRRGSSPAARVSNWEIAAGGKASPAIKIGSGSGALEGSIGWAGISTFGGGRGDIGGGDAFSGDSVGISLPLPLISGLRISFSVVEESVEEAAADRAMLFCWISFNLAAMRSDTLAVLCGAERPSTGRTLGEVV